MSIHKMNPIVKDYMDKIKKMKPEEQLDLLEALNVAVKNGNSTKKHSILELEGLGAEIWQHVDAKQYVAEERDSWN